jgi:hypothetical protein
MQLSRDATKNPFEFSKMAALSQLTLASCIKPIPSKADASLNGLFTIPFSYQTLSSLETIVAEGK